MRSHIYPTEENPTLPAWRHCLVCDRPRQWLGDGFYCLHEGCSAALTPEQQKARRGVVSGPVYTWPSLDAVRFQQKGVSA